MMAFGAKSVRWLAAAAVIGRALSGCGRFGGGSDAGNAAAQREASTPDSIPAAEKRETIWDLFRDDTDPNRVIKPNAFIWRASLDVLSFLPIETVDAFSGVIVTGYGTPPGGRQAYRATIYVRDPALEARSLSVALATRSGPASDETVRAVEDAILTRARQLYIEALNL